MTLAQLRCRRIGMILAALLLAFIHAVPVNAQQKATAPAGACKRCHDAGLPLPESHPKVAGANIAECGACHASQAGQAKPHPMAARLHRAHTKINLDCTTCHAYTPGKQFAVAGHKGSLGALDPEQYDRVRKSMVTWADSPWLAATHGAKNLSCGACHQKELIPNDNETVVNKQCVACHGDYARLAAATRPKLKNPNINPHGSHLGPEIACTVCHQGHQEAKAYCLNCHTNFNMPMPGDAGAAARAAAAK